MDRSSHRDSFPKYLFFFSRSNLFIIFQEGRFVRRTEMFFPGGSIYSLNRHEFSRRIYMFFEQTYLIEQILIFQEALSSPLTHTIFQETPMPRTHRYFPRRYPCQTDISLIGLSGCFRRWML